MTLLKNALGKDVIEVGQQFCNPGFSRQSRNDLDQFVAPRKFAGQKMKKIETADDETRYQKGD